MISRISFWRVLLFFALFLSVTTVPTPPALAATFEVSGTFSDTPTGPSPSSFLKQMAGGSFYGWFTTPSLPVTGFLQYLDSWTIYLRDSGGNTINSFSGAFPGFILEDTFSNKTLLEFYNGGSPLLLDLVFNSPFDGTGNVLVPGNPWASALFYNDGSVGNYLLLTEGHSNAVPEPSTMLLLGSGLAGLVGYGRRKFKK